MEVKELLEHIQQQYKVWKQERDQENLETHSLDKQQFLGAYMFDYAFKFKDDKDQLQTFVNRLYELEAALELGIAVDRFERIYENINMLEEPNRTFRLSKLMSEMEKEFNIPTINNEQFNRDNIEIMELYWTISYARDL